MEKLLSNYLNIIYIIKLLEPLKLKATSLTHYCLINRKNNEKNFNKWHSTRRVESSFGQWSKIIRFRYRAQIS